jgi:hypothetical protein
MLYSSTEMDTHAEVAAAADSLIVLKQQQQLQTPPTESKKGTKF